MPDELHEEVVARFVKSGTVDFEAAGRFLTDIGPALVERDKGLHGVIFGVPSMIACFLPPDAFSDVLRGLTRLGSLQEALDVQDR